MPGEVIEPERIQLHALGFHRAACHLLDQRHQHHLGGDGHVAHPHHGHIRSMQGQRLGDQPGRVGEIDQQGARRQAAHVFRDAQRHRDGAHGLGHTAHAGSLLPDQTVAPAEVLIFTASRHVAHANLGDDVSRPGNSFLAVGGQRNLEGLVVGLHHPAGEAAHHVQPLAVDVHQAQFAQWKARHPLDKTGDQLRRVGRSPTDNGDFHKYLREERE